MVKKVNISKSNNNIISFKIAMEIKVSNENDLYNESTWLSGIDIVVWNQKNIDVDFSGNILSGKVIGEVIRCLILLQFTA